MPLSLEELLIDDYGIGPDPALGLHHNVQVIASRTGTIFVLTVDDETDIADGATLTFNINGVDHVLTAKDSGSGEGDGEFSIDPLSAPNTATNMMIAINHVDWTMTGLLESPASSPSNTVTLEIDDSNGNDNVADEMIGVSTTTTPPVYQDIDNLTGGTRLAIIVPGRVSDNYQSEGTTAARILHWLLDRVRQAQETLSIPDRNKFLFYSQKFNAAKGLLTHRYKVEFDVGVNHLSDQTTEKLEDDWDDS